MEISKEEYAKLEKKVRGIAKMQKMETSIPSDKITIPATIQAISYNDFIDLKLDEHLDRSIEFFLLCTLKDGDDYIYTPRQIKPDETSVKEFEKIRDYMSLVLEDSLVIY